MSVIPKNRFGMNIIGQGGNIIYFFMPSLIVSVFLVIYPQEFNAMPESWAFLQPIGFILLAGAIVFYVITIRLLLVAFKKSTLVTSGPFAMVRNPIYANMIYFILPALSLITLTWGFFVVALFAFAGAMIFVRKEEQQLAEAFGEQYLEYVKRVHVIIPFMKPKAQDAGQRMG